MLRWPHRCQFPEHVGTRAEHVRFRRAGTHNRDTGVPDARDSGPSCADRNGHRESIPGAVPGLHVPGSCAGHLPWLAHSREAAPGRKTVDGHCRIVAVPQEEWPPEPTPAMCLGKIIATTSIPTAITEPCVIRAALRGHCARL